MKETYLSRDFRETAAQRFSSHAKELKAFFDTRLNADVYKRQATVRGLILTVSHKEQIGELYPQVLETLVYGACRELFK